MCTGENACPPKWQAFFDDVISQSELTTLFVNDFVTRSSNVNIPFGDELGTFALV